MNPPVRWTISTCAAVLAATFSLLPQGSFAAATAQVQSAHHQVGVRAKKAPAKPTVAPPGAAAQQ